MHKGLRFNGIQSMKCRTCESYFTNGKKSTAVAIMSERSAKG
jgi:transposase-like protein